MIRILAIFILFLSSCQQNPQENHYTEITIQAPQDRPADPHAGMDMSSMAIPMPIDSTSSQRFDWTLPEGWVQVPGKGMRIASFHLMANEEAIDCSVISLGGMAGGIEANLTRWMGQIGFEPSSSDFAKLIRLATSIKIKGGQEGKVFDFTTIQSKDQLIDKSMIVVMLPMQEATLFVKMTGTVKTVNENKTNFFKFAQSIEEKPAN